LAALQAVNNFSVQLHIMHASVDRELPSTFDVCLHNVLVNGISGSSLCNDMAMYAVAASFASPKNDP
jgi:hypothetical protein